MDGAAVVLLGKSEACFGALPKASPYVLLLLLLSVAYVHTTAVPYTSQAHQHQLLGRYAQLQPAPHSQAH